MTPSVVAAWEGRGARIWTSGRWSRSAGSQAICCMDKSVSVDEIARAIIDT